MSEQTSLLPEDRIAQLEARVASLQERVQTTNELANSNRGVLELSLGLVLVLTRWAYAWSKKQGCTNRLEQLKAAGIQIKDLLASLEPPF